jgi:hypothetical protein
MVGPLIVGLVALSIPTVCLLVGWAIRQTKEESCKPHKLRDRITLAGLVSASIAMLANGVFLLHGAAQGRGGFLGRPEGGWLIVNRVALVLWLVAVIASILGKGRPRIALATWSLLVIGVDYFIVINSMD